MSALMLLTGLLSDATFAAAPREAARAESEPLPPGRVKGPGRPDIDRVTQPPAAPGTPRDRAADKLRTADGDRRTASDPGPSVLPRPLREAAAREKILRASGVGPVAVLPGEPEHDREIERRGRKPGKEPSLAALAAPPGDRPGDRAGAGAVAAATYGASYPTISGWDPAPSYAQFGRIRVTVCNESSFTWTTSNHALGYHLYNANGDVYNFTGGWTAFASNVGSGSCAAVWLWTEELPTGSFKIVFDMYEYSTHSWFSEQGVPASRAVAFTVPHYAPSASLEYPANLSTTETLNHQFIALVEHDASRAVDVYYEMCGTIERVRQCWNSNWLPVDVYPSSYDSLTTWKPPAAAMRWNITYEWRVRVRDNSATTPFSSWAYFTPVVTPPTAGQFGADPSSIDAAGVNIWLGGFTRVEKDLTLPGIGLPLEITRTYNSTNTAVGLFGTGWSSFLDMRSVQETGGFIRIVYPDGKQIRYGRNPDGGYVPHYGQGAGATVLDAQNVTLPGGTRYVFNTNGTIARITAPNGDALEIGYSGGVPVKVTSTRSGRAIHLTVVDGHITRVSTHPAGTTGADVMTWTYTYSFDLLTRTCDPRIETRCWTRYSYSGAQGQLSDIALASNRHPVRITYDGSRVSHVDLLDTSDTEVDGGWSYVREDPDTDAGTQVVRVLDPRGNTMSYEFGPDGELWQRWYNSLSPLEGNTRIWLYHGDGRLWGMIDENGNSTEYFWDSLTGQLADVNRWRDDVTMTNTHTDHLWFAAGDPRNGLPELVKDANGNESRFTYDTNGRLLTRSEPAAPPGTGALTRYTYTCQGGAAAPPVVNAPDAPPGALQPCGLLASVTDQENRVTRYAYNSHGDRTRVVTPTGLTTDTTYHGLLGRVTSVMTDDLDGSAMITAHTYDELGRPYQTTESPVVNPVSGVAHRKQTTTRYDLYGNLSEVTTADLTPAAEGGDPARTVAYAYDARNRLTQVTENGTITQRMRYDGLGNVIESWSPEGARYTFFYDTANLLSSVWLNDFTDDPAGGGTPRDVPLAWYGYDFAGRASSVTDEMGATVLYDYTADDLMLRQSVLGEGPGGTDLLLHAYAYDAAGNVVQDTTGAGQDARTARMAYLANGRLSSTTVAPGVDQRVTTYSLTAAGNISRTLLQGQDSVREATINRFGLAGVLQSAVLTGENPITLQATRFTRDAAGRVTSTTDPRGVTFPESGTDASSALGTTDPAYTTTYTYDLTGRLSSTVLPPVRAEDGGEPVTVSPTTVNGYNTFGELTHVRDEAGKVTVHEFDVRGRRTSTTHPAYTPPGASQAIVPKETWSYDVSGNTKTYTDRLGRTTDYTYDVRNRLVRITRPAAEEGAERGVIRMVHDDGGRLLSTVDATGAQELRGYDGLGQVTSVTRVVRDGAATPKRYTTTYAYNQFGQVTQVSPAPGDFTTYSYDHHGDLWQIRDNNTTYLYRDIAGRLTSAVSGDRARHWDRDRTGRVTAVWDDNGVGQPLARTEYRRDGAGNATEVTDPNGGVWKAAYDALGRLTSLTDPPTTAADGTVRAGARTQLGYDVMGNNTRVTDAGNHVRATTFNTLGLPERVTEPSTEAHPDPAQRTWTTSYDAAGNTTRTEAPGGVVRTARYDRLSRPVSVTATGGDRSGERLFGYDLADRLTSAGLAGQQAQTFAYDDRGLLTSSGGPAGASSFAYDALDRVTRQTDAAGTVDYTYAQGMARLGPSTRTDSVTGTTTTYGYDHSYGLLMNEETRSAAGTVVQKRAYTYDNQHRLLTDTATGQENVTQKYGWDKAGNLVSATSGGTVASPRTEEYDYDEAGRLIRASDTTHGTGSDYFWDAVGNRTRTVDWTEDAQGDRTDTGTVTAEYDARDRILSATGSDGTATAYEYTARGTLDRTTVTTEDGSTTTGTSFDAFDQLIADGTARYGYDALGRLGGAAQEGTAPAGFTYAGMSKEASTDGTFAYVRGPDSGPVAAKPLAGGAPSMLLSNLHGDVIAQRDPATGKITGSREYDPFGAVDATLGDSANTGFQGSWTDPATGRVNAQARWYSPDTGTFASADSAAVPLTDATSANAYTYGNANPATLSDPSGYFSIGGYDVGIDIGKYGGRLLGAAEDAAGKVGWRGAVRAGARVGSRFVPVVGWVMLAADVAGVVAYIVNADGSMTRTKDAYDPEMDPCYITPDDCRRPTEAAPRKIPVPKVEPKKVTPPPVHVTGTRTTSSTKAWDTSKTWWDNTYLYNRTDNYTYTTQYLWTYFSNGDWNKKVSGTSWTHFYEITRRLLIDLSDPLVLDTPTVGAPVAPESPDSATPTGSCTGGGSMLDCAGLQRAGTLPPGALTGGSGCSGGMLGYQCTASGNLLDPETGTTYCNPGGAATGSVCTPSSPGAGPGPSGGGSCERNSFTPDTPVLMADGTTKPIKDVETGDRVLATDPETGISEAKTVTATITGEGAKRLVEVTIDTDGDSGTATASVTATAGHPFWVPRLNEWITADRLEPGAWLRTNTGTWVQITAVDRHGEQATVHNLTVEDLHTYYVLAGGVPILVHNADCGANTDGYLYRGLAKGHHAYGDAVNGRATPLGKHTDIADHVGANNTDSIFTSWTDEIETAIDSAEHLDDTWVGEGVMLRIKVADIDPLIGPSRNIQIHGGKHDQLEYEHLLVGGIMASDISFDFGVTWRSVTGE
ncbi:polymorphic toxin-type HINT domain-containing protein [Streptomyces sp. NBC_00872]|uniref:polymorphic toxin-type HINT domain-containing protein n=1 Tax=Streptomyces sp. NBC_00872 TaxID=2903686 RepID=UPI00386E9844|nr:polymorphic toxin-type HINT domain-containing protein [Streptomyces sp. NBC_00872]